MTYHFGLSTRSGLSVLLSKKYGRFYKSIDRLREYHSVWNGLFVHPGTLVEKCTGEANAHILRGQFDFSGLCCYLELSPLTAVTAVPQGEHPPFSSI